MSAVLVWSVVAAAPAADPAPTPFDAAVRASLAEVHDAGADLYNKGKDYVGAYRLYEGALRAVRPLMGHRPRTQHHIAEGLAKAAAEPEPARKAYTLHRTIEGVRAELKPAAKSSGVEVAPPPRVK